MCLDSSVGRAPAWIAVGPRFDSSFGHYLLLRSVVTRSRCWTLTAMRLFHPSQSAANDQEMESETESDSTQD